MPFYTGDYRRDTQHLSMMEHGAYMLMLAHCWDLRGPLPLDERRVFGICNARSNEEMGAVRHILAEFFTRMDDGHYNRRIQLEIERADALSSKRSSAGRKGYDAKAKLLTRDMFQANAEQEPLPPPPHSPPEIQEKGQGSRYAKASRMTLKSLPASWAAWAAEDFPGVSASQAFQRFRDYWIAIPGAKGTKLDWFATWRNWIRRDNPNRGMDADAALIASMENDPRFKGKS